MLDELQVLKDVRDLLQEIYDKIEMGRFHITNGNGLDTPATIRIITRVVSSSIQLDALIGERTDGEKDNFHEKKRNGKNHNKG
jgi:hypothetical protein